jgi:anaerobic selenocysteine-containing dehydrogenase
VRDGRVVREEPAATFETIEAGVPDMNPAGCQKGAAWSQMLHGKDRVLHPLRRVGERGEGKWKRVSWDEALTEIADARLDAIQESGPRSIVRFGTTEGGIQTLALANNLFLHLGATVIFTFSTRAARESSRLHGRSISAASSRLCKEATRQRIAGISGRLTWNACGGTAEVDRALAVAKRMALRYEWSPCRSAPSASFLQLADLMKR